MALANLVGVEGAAPSANAPTYQRAFLSARQATDARSGRGCAGYR